MKLVKFRVYLVGNPGAPCIVVFGGLVFTCAYLLILKSLNAANALGNPANGSAITYSVDSTLESTAFLAYCFLIVGIALQAVGYINERASGRASLFE